MLLNQRSRLFLLLFAFVGLRIISVNFDNGWVPLIDSPGHLGDPKGPKIRQFE